MPEPVRSRTPMMLMAALALALPLILTAGIGIYRAERQAHNVAPKHLAAPSDAPDPAHLDRDGDAAAR